MWKVECPHCKKKGELSDLHPVDKSAHNMDIVVLSFCEHCGRQIEMTLSFTTSEGIIYFD